MILQSMKIFANTECEDFDIEILGFYSSDEREVITAAITSKKASANMVRVKSSNLWAYGISGREGQENRLGDVYIQFKGKKGGPGDVYVYYDVPVKIFRKLLSAPSKGHAFWQYIRGKYTYAKLTGDRKTKMPGGVDYKGTLDKIEKSVLQLMDSDNVEDRIKAVNKTEDNEIFRKLATDPSEKVRAEVAKRCKDIDILEDLALDDSALVRKSLINRKDTNRDILRLLAYDDDPMTRYEMTKVCKDKSILKEMLDDPNIKVRNSARRQLSKLEKGSKS